MDKQRLSYAVCRMRTAVIQKNALVFRERLTLGRDATQRRFKHWLVSAKNKDS
jgi:hypothetical protein